MAVVVCGSILLATRPAPAQTAGATPPAATCTEADLSKAVDKAGAALRRVNVDSTPKIQAKMQQLRDRRGWSTATYEMEAMAAIADDRITQLDTQASELIDRIDQLSRARSSTDVDCATIADIETTAIELVATIRAKTSYVMARLDVALATDAKPAAAAATPPAPVAAPVVPPTPQPQQAAAPPAVQAPPAVRPPSAPVIVPAAPPPAKTQPPGWSTTTSQSANPPPTGAGPVVSNDVFIPAAEAEGYSVEEIREATRGFFGQITTGLAEVIEHAFAKSGKPTAYVLGSEGGGAFVAGLRYGEGDLFVRTGGTRKVFWHGPSLGGDLGISGTKTMMLIYKLDTPEALFSRFSGIDGSAFFVGGVGLTLLTNGRTVMAPIRSGVGLRIGASIGYLRFTETQTWNPF